MAEMMSLPTLPSLQARMAWARGQKGLTYEAIAKRMENPVNWLILRQLEHGHAESSKPELLADLAKALGVDRDWFLGVEAPKEELPILSKTVKSRVLPAQLPKKAEKPTEVVWRPGLMKPQPPETLAARVRAIRLKMGLSQTQLSHRVALARPDLSVSVTAVSYLERNNYKKMVRTTVVDAVLNFLNIQDPDWETFKKENPISTSRAETQPVTPKVVIPPNLPVHTYLHTVTGAGERVKTLRESLGLTQRQLAEMTDVHQTAISRIERSMETSPISVPALVKALKTTADYLLHGGQDSLTEALHITAHAQRQPVHVNMTAYSLPTDAQFKKAEREAARRAKAGTPMPVPVLPDTKAGEPTVEDAGTAKDVIRPALIDSVRTIADKTGVYLFCQRRGFRRNGSVLSPVGISVASLALSPELAEMLIEDLRDAVKQTRDLRTPRS